MSQRAILTLGSIVFLLFSAFCLWSHRGLSMMAEPAGLSVPSQESAFFEAARGADGKVTLDGVIPNEDGRKAIVGAATTAFGADGFVDQLRVGSGAGSLLPSQIGSLLPLVSRLGDTGRLAVGESLTLTGKVGSASAETQILDAARAAVGATRVIDAIDVLSPKDAATSLQSGLEQLLLHRVIQFETGSARISPSGHALLDDIASRIQDSPDTLIAIAGHTDNVGNAAANIELSTQRARAVSAYLASQGVASQRLSATGYGAARPRDTNDTPEGRARNRRIEFSVSLPPSPRS